MSTRLAPIGHKRFEKFLEHVGCTFVRQEGSHRIYRRADLNRPLVIPARTLPRRVVKSNLRTLGISTKEYLKIMEVM